jgi:ABC-2 type transport system ATP-binding protein
MSPDTQPIIQTVELTKIYKDFWGRGRVRALDGLDLEVHPGEVFGLLGPNGSGKTTTVRLLLGLLFPSRGVVRLFGSPPQEVDVKQRVGYMPEESHLYEYLNAEETLDFFGRIFGLGREERRRRADSLIEMVGLERARHRAVGEFSKGMARRIGLAQALINDPDLLILDEPTTGLDPLGARQMKDLIETLKGRGKTIFLCSHLLADVEEVCDRIGILYGGKARSMGPVGDLLEEETQLEIRTPRLPDDVLEELRTLIRERVGEGEKIEVGSPARRLEEYFLGVVEEARREKLSTAGAEAGGPAAEFLSPEEEEEEAGERMIEELVTAGEKEAEGETETPETPEPEPVPASESGGEDRKMIEDLTAAPERPETEGETEPESPPEGGVEHDLIEELVEAGEEETEEQESDRETD